MQQINLYLPEFRPNLEPLRSIHMLWGLGAFFVFLVLMAFVSMNTNAKLKMQLESDRAQVAVMNTQVKQMIEQQPKNNLAALDEELLALTAGLERRNQIFGIVADKDLGNNQGFSEYIKALGRQSMNTIALDVFSLQKGGSYIEFAGKTTSADQIPLYIQKLRTESVFEKVAFGVLNVEQSADTNAILSFSLAKITSKEAEVKTPKTAVQMLLELNEKAMGDK